MQVAKRAGATILSLAGPAGNAWLTDHAATPVNNRATLAAGLKAAVPGGQADAFLDFFGNEYVPLASEEPASNSIVSKRSNPFN